MNEFFDDMSHAAGKEVMQVLEQLPGKLSELDSKVRSMNERSYVEVESGLASSINAEAPSKTDTLVSMLGYTRAELVSCASNLRKVERYIMLMVPRIEDGNNFGTQIQYEIRKMVTELRTKIKEVFDKLADYHKDRAALWKEISPKSSKDTTVSKSTTTEDGADKETAKTSTEEKASQSVPLPDAVAAIAAFDTNWYFQVALALEQCKDAYVTAFVAFVKNQDKIERPKGEGAGGMNMF